MPRSSRRTIGTVWSLLLLAVTALAGCGGPTVGDDPPIILGDPHGEMQVAIHEPTTREIEGAGKWRIDQRTEYSNGVADATTATIHVQALNGPLILVGADQGGYKLVVSAFAFGEDEPDARAKLDLVDIVVNETLQDGHLSLHLSIVTPPGADGAGGSVSVTLPANLVLDATLRNSLAPVSAFGVQGDRLDVRTVKGGVLASGAWDNIQIEASANPVSVDTGRRTDGQGLYRIHNEGAAVNLGLDASGAYDVTALGEQVEIHLQDADELPDGPDGQARQRSKDFEQNRQKVFVDVVATLSAATVGEQV